MLVGSVSVAEVGSDVGEDSSGVDLAFADIVARHRGVHTREGGVGWVEHMHEGGRVVEEVASDEVVGGCDGEGGGSHCEEVRG